MLKKRKRTRFLPEEVCALRRRKEVDPTRGYKKDKKGLVTTKYDDEEKKENFQTNVAKEIHPFYTIRCVFQRQNNHLSQKEYLFMRILSFSPHYSTLLRCTHRFPSASTPKFFRRAFPSCRSLRRADKVCTYIHNRHACMHL